jgi:uncharacterized surface protein with fasciclin (FAS1) repeats
MKSTLKSLISFVGFAGLSLSISLPALAQSSPSPNNPSPSPGTGVLDQPSGEQAPGSTMMDEPSNYQTSPSTDAPTRSQNPMGTNELMTAGAMTSEMTIAEIVDRSPSFELLNALLAVAALESSDLKDTLKEGEYTVFAPTDEAFAALPEGTIRALVQPENRDLLVELLSYHIVPGEVASSDVSAVSRGDRFDASSLPPSGELRPNENVAAVDESEIPEPTQNSTDMAQGGMDMSSPGGSPTAPSGDSAGLTPPSGELNPNENVGAVDRTQVIEPTEQGTSDDQRRAGRDMNEPMISSDITTGGVTLSGARVIGADVQASNGIIHAIDRVIIPTELQARIAEALSEAN